MSLNCVVKPCIKNKNKIYVFQRKKNPVKFRQQMVLPSYEGTLEDIIYHRKPTILLALREEIENACAAIISMSMVTQAAVHHANKCLQANGHQSEHLF